MTNEQLALLIQGGHKEHVLTLWQQVEKFVKMKANAFFPRLANPRGVTPDDLMQAGFLAMMDATATFSEGNFLSWLSFYLKIRFYEAAGIRTVRARCDPINSVVSMDAPLDDDTEDTLADLVADPVDQYETANEKIWNEELRAALDAALDKLPQRESAVIRSRFYDGLSLAATGKQMGVSAERVRQLQTRGLKKLRQTAPRSGIERFIDEASIFYRHGPRPVEDLVAWRQWLREKITSNTNNE